MPRSLWKAPFSIIKLQKGKKGSQSKQQIWSRASVVLPTHFGERVFVHNGKGWIQVQVTEQMIGHKYGEFASTRKKAIHRSKIFQGSNRKK